MNRRHFLCSASAVSACFAFSKKGLLFAEETSSSWRTFEVTTRVEVLKPSGTTRIWVPAALIAQTPFQKTRKPIRPTLRPLAKLTVRPTKAPPGRVGAG